MNNNKYKILLVEDEANIRNMVATVLEASGYQTIPADTCANAMMMYASYHPDLIILDLGLPDRDGMQLLELVRGESLIPIIVLSARTDDDDKVLALDSGANDYVTKPFSSAELLARVRSALRTSRYAVVSSPNHQFTSHDLTINYESRQVFIGGSEVKLTQTEYNIVALLAEHCGKMMTYSTIIRSIWGHPDEGSTKKLQVNMANIRRKFGIKPGDNRYITNEIGVGYRMNSEQE